MNEITDTLIRRIVYFLVVALASVSLAACGDEMSAGDGNGANYTPYDIYSAVIYDADGFRLGATGPVRAWVHGHGEPENGSFYGGGGGCCVSYPEHWEKDRKFIIKWVRYTNPWYEKKIGRRTAYVATVTVPPYRHYQAGGVYVQFMPDDKVRLYIPDVDAVSERVDKEPGWNYLAQPPADDPYIYQGEVDPEPTARLQAEDEAREVGEAKAAAREAAIPPEEKKRRQEAIDREARLWRITEEAFKPVLACVQEKSAEGKSDGEGNRLCAKEINRCKETLSQPEFRPGYAELQCVPFVSPAL